MKNWQKYIRRKSNWLAIAFLPSPDESKRARPTIRCHVDRAFLLDISPTFFSPVNLFPLPLPLLLSTPRYENSIISKFRFRTKTRINSISPLFIRRLIEISMQMVRTDEEISRRTGFLPTLLRNVIGKDYNRMNFPSPRGNLFFTTRRNYLATRAKYRQFYASLDRISIDYLILWLWSAKRLCCSESLHSNNPYSINLTENLVFRNKFLQVRITIKNLSLKKRI